MSIGCVLANRLTANGRHKVLLLEAGPRDTDPWIHIPLGWGKILQGRLHDWMYFAEPEAGVEVGAGEQVADHGRAPSAVRLLPMLTRS